MRAGFEQMAAGFEAGFDSLNIAEHHYSTSQMSPSPHLFAAALGEYLPEANIGVMGTDLPLHNPVFVAEQYASLDIMLNGRLRFGLLRGTPNEYLTYGTNPWESRERFEEAVELVIRALTEPEPFGWEGRYYRFRNIAVFPQSVQVPHPPILLSANSVSSAQFAARMRCDVGVSYYSAEQAAPSIAAYRQAAEEHGWTPTADNIVYRQFVYVAETDEQAREEVLAANWPHGSGMFSSRNPELMTVMATAGAAQAGAPKGFVADPSKAPSPFGSAWVGSPETVIEKIRAAQQVLGMGRVELTLAGIAGSCSHEQILRGIKLIGKEIIPELHREEAHR
ncbi:LLM class flavin-dependent oxidoreductase [Mycolicibacterium sp. CBM1]